MKLINLKCNCCGGDLTVIEGTSVVECSYCGNQMLLDDDVQRHEIIIQGGYKFGQEVMQGGLDAIDENNKKVRRRLFLMKLKDIILGVALIPLVSLLCVLFQFVVGTTMIADNLWIYCVILAVVEVKYIKYFRSKYNY